MAEQLKKLESNFMKNNLKKRYGSIANFIVQKQEELKLKNIVLSDELGFKSPNMVSMIRNGKCKLPLVSIKKTAQVLGVELEELYAFYLEEYEPDHFEIYQSLYGK